MATIAGVGLGRVLDVIPIAAGQGFSIVNANAVDFVCTGADTFTLTVATSFAGTYRAYNYFTPNFTPFTYWYQRADTNGTHAWTRQTQVAASAVTQGSAYTTVIPLFSTQLPDGYNYVKMSVGASGLVCAVLHDLSVARTPANLQILGA
jgi:hypothetical protein